MTAELVQVEDFQYTTALTLKFDLDLWKVNSDNCRRCWTFTPKISWTSDF